jgi:hypothetical protein
MPDTDLMHIGLPQLEQTLVAGQQPRPPRRRTCLNGKLVFSDTMSPPDGSLTLDCMIHDISDGGAKVILARRQLLPFQLYLIVVKYCVAYWAQVVWLNYPARGLKFCKTYAMDGFLPDDMKYIRALWSDLSDRPGHVEW